MTLAIVSLTYIAPSALSTPPVATMPWSTRKETDGEEDICLMNP